MSKKKVFYFAYGERINIKEMEELPFDYKDHGKAILKNASLFFKGIHVGVPTIEKVEGASVVGRLYEIEAKDFDVSKLKLREGYLHTMSKIMVKTAGGDKVKAYTFVVKDIINDNANFKHDYVPVHKSIYRSMKEGYELLGLKLERLESAAVETLKRHYAKDYYNEQTRSKRKNG